METNKIYNMDCLEGMKQLPDEMINCIIIDPPYSSGLVSKTLNGRYKKDKFLIKYDEMSSRAFLIFLKDRLLEMWRISKVGCHLYCFSDWKSLRDVMDTIELSSWKVNKVLVWDKLTFGTGRPYRSQVEFIIFASKSSPKTFEILNHADIFQHKRVRDVVAYTKPLNLIKEIIQISTKKGNLILDCFMGSGTTAVASKELDRNFIGYEIDEKYYDIAVGRIQL